jgi:hypothetical protein
VAEYSFLVPDLTPTQFYEELSMLHPRLLEITGVKELYFNMAPDGRPGDDYNRLVMVEPKISDGRVAWIMAIPERGFAEIGPAAKFTLGTRIICTNGPIRGDRQHDRPLGNIFDKIIEAIHARLQQMVMGNDRARDIGPLEPKSHLPQGQSEGLLPSEGSPPTVINAQRFRVALSFPGEHRAFLADVAAHLACNVGKERVFYDAYYEAELARPDLDTYLQAIYHDQSELIVVFLCADYERKEWCGLEWRAIRDLLKKKQAAMIMPIRFDNTHIPGLFSIDGYVTVGERSPDAIAALIMQRLGCDVQQSHSQ